MVPSPELCFSFLCVSCCARFAELFVAAAAGEAVAVLLSSSLMLPSVAGAGRCTVVAFFFFFPQVIRLARCGHRVLGGARMVDVTGCHVAVLALPLLSCLLLPLLVTRCGAAF